MSLQREKTEVHEMSRKIEKLLRTVAELEELDRGLVGVADSDELSEDELDTVAAARSAPDYAAFLKMAEEKRK